MTSKQEKTIRDRCEVTFVKGECDCKVCQLEALNYHAQYGDFEAWGKTAEDSVENLVTHMKYYEVSRKD